jgi:hypothetical protein
LLLISGASPSVFNLARRGRERNHEPGIEPAKREIAAMKTLLHATALAAVTITLALVSAPANAKGCLKGAAVGGVAGHVAGHHGLIGAAAGCAIGHHEANKQDKTNPAPDKTQQ